MFIQPPMYVEAVHFLLTGRGGGVVPVCGQPVVFTKPVRFSDLTKAVNRILGLI